ncbi:MAG: UDP-N-acetylmuramate dehydrogenase [Deltaproteobacteria bacterium]|nr:UDP-N-acetylmuramate dehydrogenase [Deltaproteobacteria bacterium]
MGLIRENVPLAPLTYYKIGGPARWFAQPTSLEELGQVADFLASNRMPYFVLGAGSNVLLDDAGFDGLVLGTTKLDPSLDSSDPSKEVLTVGASVPVIQLLRACMREGISGFELLVGIPGNMGGVFAMNAGTRLGEIEKAIVELTLYDLATKTSRTLPRARLSYGYRSQRFLGPHELIVGGKLRGTRSEPKKVQDEVQALLAARKKAQPIDKPSCGSVFKNPDPAKGVHAWKVVADVGLRGHRIGGAQVSELHTNFIVNLGGATASDVRALIDEAKARAKDRLGVTLEEEVQIVAHDGGKRLS